jgi:hypothetical protein
VLVTPLPVIALFVFVEGGVFAIWVVIVVPIGVVDHDFVIVPVMIVMMVLVVIADPGSATRSADGNDGGGRKNQKSRVTSENSHALNPPLMTSYHEIVLFLRGTQGQ